MLYISTISIVPERMENLTKPWSQNANPDLTESKKLIALSTITHCLSNIINTLKWSFVERTSPPSTVKGITQRQEALPSCVLHVQSLSSPVIPCSCYHPLVSGLFRPGTVGVMEITDIHFGKKQSGFSFSFWESFLH